MVKFFCEGVIAGCDPTTPELYCASLYHATMTLTTIGYGDLVANTTPERWVSIGIQLVGASLYAYIVGVASGIVASMNKQRMQFQETMDELNEVSAWFGSGLWCVSISWCCSHSHSGCI